MFGKVFAALWRGHQACFCFLPFCDLGSAGDEFVAGAEDDGPWTAVEEFLGQDIPDYAGDSSRGDGHRQLSPRFFGGSCFRLTVLPKFRKFGCLSGRGRRVSQPAAVQSSMQLRITAGTRSLF